MKSWMAGMLVALVMTAPLAAGQGINTSASTDVRAVNTLSLGLRQVGESFSDFVFRIKAILTFDERARLDLLKARNEEMKSRQHAWLKIKSDMLAQVKAGNLTAEEKQQVMKQVKAEHEAIIREHFGLTADMRKIQLKAKAHGRTELERSAEEEADEAEESDVSLGLNIGAELSIGVSENVTADQAKTLVGEKLGFETADVRTETRNGTTFYVVSGTETSAAGNYTLKKGFEAWVRADTGMIHSLGMDARLDSAVGVSV
ncbi:MAG: hypothetical protein HY516_02095 [Candidatus Aenigmarchaeota archaeon]|nr:hypothetical protein [Candidatus Aenigmarchaeota archaeon]